MKFNQGEFTLSASELDQMNTLIAQLGDNTSPDFHRLFAQRIFGPIVTKAAFEEVYNNFFQTEQVGAGEIIRIAQADYIGVATYTSPDGQTGFVRPGRKYAYPSFRMVNAGMEFGWDDMAEAGWPLLSHYIAQAGEELARKRDARAKVVLDASIAGQSGHTVSSQGVLTRSAVDSVLRAAAVNKFAITFALISPSTAMDMAQWTTPVNTLWNTPEELGRQVIQQGWISNYGGILWIPKRFASTTTVYFGGIPSDNGCWRFQKGGTRTASDTNIEKRMDRYVWDEKWGHYIDGGQACYKINIV